ncbi:MAG TPA: M67 family metallopeptidase [Vicinamibacterales bacterium]|nr:M67 family metallopeptidase [Vicinamibacterales bacterium]
MTRPPHWTLAREVLAGIVHHARRDRPRECCGLLVGRRGLVLAAVATRNVAKGQSRYQIDDAAHIELRRILRACSPRLEIVGVYHSHPAGPARPSGTDIAQAFYPGWIHLIVGMKGRASVRAYRIASGRVQEVSIRRKSGHSI